MEQSQLTDPKLANGARKTSLLTGRKLEQDQPLMIKEETSAQNLSVFSFYDKIQDTNEGARGILSVFRRGSPSR